MAFLPDGGILITERPGRLRMVRDGVLAADPILGVPAVRTRGTPALWDTGLMDIALHPRFAENGYVYLTYHKADPSRPNGYVIALARGRWDGSALTNVQDIFEAGRGTASRITFGRDGLIYMSVGVLDPPALGELAQDTSSLGGKVLRLRDDGSVPPDNPFVGRPGYRPEIYTMGHRNGLGLALNPVTGEIWEAEAGPNGGDEINVLKPGRNYGHPVVGFGRFYAGPRMSDRPWREDMEQPLVFWVPAITVSGMTFYTGDKFSNWRNHVFVGGLRSGAPRTGQIERIEFNANWEEIQREPLLRELRNRIRDVRQGPDGFLYALTGEFDGALLRIEPYDPSGTSKR
jgi:glucose/arabinose dehydrogenase